MLTHETTVRVRYAETDQMGVAYHSNFLVWFEIGRVELLRALGIRYRDMEQADDCHIIVGDVHVSYRLPARYDDLLRIRTRVTEVRTRMIRFGYEILRDPSAELLATGETMHVVTGRDGRPKTLPEKYRALLAIEGAAPSAANSVQRTAP